MSEPGAAGPPHIAIFVSFSGQGGVERMVVNLCRGLIDLGCQLDLVLVKSRSAHLKDLPAEVRVVQLKASHTLASILELTAYLRRERPRAMLAAKDRAGRVAVLARVLAGVSTRLVFRIGTTVSGALEGRHPFRKWLWYVPMRLIYPKADGIVAVSSGVAEDLERITGLGPERFRVIPNPVITPRLEALAAAGVDHPWFDDRTAPVILGVGRLTRQKDFSTLIKAVARVRETRPCRLLILGEGGDRARLEREARESGLGEDFSLPGFDSNPYRFLSRADLFVLSSAWEGSPNALTEALALGVPVVATDCPSGPREILAGGRIAPLVPVGDVEALAAAIHSVLAQPPSAESLRRAAAPYNVADSSRQYLELLLPGRSG